VVGPRGLRRCRWYGGGASGLALALYAQGATVQRAPGASTHQSTARDGVFCTGALGRVRATWRVV